jgi:hypothetical protein
LFAIELSQARRVVRLHHSAVTIGIILFLLRQA